MEFPSKVLVLGSGAIKIAEAAEFDYSGSQALKALKEEGIKTILINPNVATIQTSHELADRVYLIPLKLEFVSKVIERERPDGILLGFGGQTALSLGVALYRHGILNKYGVKVLGTPIRGIEKALNRDLFRKTMREWKLPIPPSLPTTTPKEAIEAAKKLGYPVMVRISFNLGGRGSFIAWSNEEFKKHILRAFAHSEIKLVLVEKYLHNWKEIEFEVVRDRRGNSIAVACLENIDPMGIHTGESVVVAPCQTLTNREYQLLRLASLKVAEAIELVGECNVQLALNPNSETFYIIETNPRMSRSSALASKATGYPLAYIATKLALGYTLDEVLNKVTGITCACFEPSLDYIVVKMPRWDLKKFEKVERSIATEMKSIGEVMAIGRNLHEAFQKAIRMLDIGEPGLVAGPYYEENENLENILEKLRRREPYWPLHVAKALKLGANIDEIHKITGIDKFYLYIINDIVKIAEKLRGRNLNEPNIDILIREAKEKGFSDEQIANLLRTSLSNIRNFRIEKGIKPCVKQIDTLAAEWPAKTNYLYMTYAGLEDDIPQGSRKKPSIIVLGAGVFRIGVSVEFDWTAVNFANAARRRGFEVIVVNYNPETVSTDWDMNEKLYFEEITLERILDIIDHEKPIGVAVFTGGQLTNNLAKKLEDSGVYLLGSSGSSIDRAEDRAKFSKLIEYLGIKQPPWKEASSLKEILKFVEEVGYPVIVRPSYVLSGTAMKIAYNTEELLHYLSLATKVSAKYPVVISKFITNAIEAEVDAVSDGKRVVGVTIEHIEKAGVHSGDATMVIPPKRIDNGIIHKMHEAILRLALELNIKGPFNVQFVIRDGDVYLLELNLRASRSMPFSSKSRGVNFMELAAQAVFDKEMKIGNKYEYFEIPTKAWAVKTPQFSWAQLRGSYPFLGPEMRSTGEVACLSSMYEDALLKSWLSATPNNIPSRNSNILIYTYKKYDKEVLNEVCYFLTRSGYNVITLEDTLINGVETVSKTLAVEYMRKGKISLLITSGYNPPLDYYIRRTAADLNIPLILDANLAYELSRAILKYSKGNWKFEINELSEYWIYNIMEIQ